MNNELRLLKIHTRRRDELIKQKIALGGRADVSIQIEIEGITDTILEIEMEVERRSQKLRETAALYGSSVDPSISMEIEDIEDYFKAKNKVKE